MNDKEQAANEIRKYMDLLRIKVSKNRDIEIDNQLQQSAVILETLGVHVDDLTIKTE